MQDDILIQMKNISKTYKMGENYVSALKDITLEILTGEFAAFYGPSGSGKSTLMNIIGCIDILDSGEYYLDGRNITDLTDDELAGIRVEKIGFIFQQFNLLPKYNAVQNVELPLLLRGIPRSKARKAAQEVLEKVGLEARMNHKPSELSGGQQQRVAIARALVGNPGIILADEPTGNLDSKSGVEIMGLITELNRQGHTIVLITHDIEVARLAGRIIGIKDGTITMDELVRGK